MVQSAAPRHIPYEATTHRTVAFGQVITVRRNVGVHYHGGLHTGLPPALSNQAGA